MNVALHPPSLLVAVFDGFGEFCYVDLIKIKKCNIFFWPEFRVMPQ